jgi:hypothetical protein
MALATSVDAAPRQTATVLAFPGAEGFGRFTSGGRGGRVIKVTNLNDDGPGSLRAAIEASGPRTIVFDVDGTIALRRDLELRNGDVTIAGQTAPGGGVALKNHALIIAADNVIVRYIRSRMGDEAKAENDAIDVRAGSNIIIDHVSASWANDETLSVTQNYKPGGPVKHLTNVTVQWSIISESMNNAGHEKGEHGYGSLIQGSYGARYSFHHNLWAHHQSRMPRIGNYASKADDPEGVLYDFRNNVFYNWGDGATTDFYNWAPGLARGYNMDPFYGRPDNKSRYAAGANLNSNTVTKANFVNNAYIQGANTGAPLILYLRNQGAEVHVSGNSMDGRVMPDQWGAVISSRGDDWRRPEPFDWAGVKTQSASAALKAVLANAGASRWRDPVDRRVVQSVRERSGRIINSQADVGGWPELPKGEARLDSDGDGMPDAWERGRRLKPNDPSDGAADRNGDGVTNLEDWLNSLAS